MTDIAQLPDKLIDLTRQDRLLWHKTFVNWKEAFEGKYDLWHHRIIKIKQHRAIKKRWLKIFTYECYEHFNTYYFEITSHPDGFYNKYNGNPTFSHRFTNILSQTKLDDLWDFLECEFEKTDIGIYIENILSENNCL